MENNEFLKYSENHASTLTSPNSEDTVSQGSHAQSCKMIGKVKINYRQIWQKLIEKTFYLDFLQITFILRKMC